MLTWSETKIVKIRRRSEIQLETKQRRSKKKRDSACDQRALKVERNIQMLNQSVAMGKLDLCRQVGKTQEGRRRQGKHWRNRQRRRLKNRRARWVRLMNVHGCCYSCCVLLKTGLTREKDHHPRHPTRKNSSDDKFPLLGKRRKEIRSC